MATFDKTIAWINKTGKSFVSQISDLIEGRDKFCKTIQYASRFLMWATQDKNKELSARFKGLFSNKDSSFHNKIFRWDEECQKVVQTLQEFK
jgi:Peroxisomal biogenesis factor 11 (PEX11).